MGSPQAQTLDLIRRIFTPDTIGPADCPILYRWTLFPPGFGSNSSSTRHLHKAPDWLPKLLLHHFVPQADERDFHDHPRAFWTLVLRGGYDDLSPCAQCRGIGRLPSRIITISDYECWACSGSGIGASETMKVGMLRYRPAEHRHRTRVHPGGAWTLVLMGPWRREWGFWPGGQFMRWQEYFKRFGYGMRCV